MNIEIRLAVPQDAPAIVEIARLCFGEALDEARVRALLLERPATFAARRAGRAVGFADGFLTVAAGGEGRFELDLLAVHPQARRRGAARQLMLASVAQARRLGAASLRLLVAADNRGMQRLCEGLGFRRAAGGFALFARSPAAARRQAAADAHLIAVETLTYSGIWLEGRISQAAIENALAAADARGLMRVGAVVPQGDSAVQERLQSLGFACWGDYDWWSLSL